MYTLLLVIVASVVQVHCGERAHEVALYVAQTVCTISTLQGACLATSLAIEPSTRAAP
jgi:hypothetical protein